MSVDPFAETYEILLGHVRLLKNDMNELAKRHFGERHEGHYDNYFNVIETFILSKRNEQWDKVGERMEVCALRDALDRQMADVGRLEDKLERIESIILEEQ